MLSLILIGFALAAAPLAASQELASAVPRAGETRPLVVSPLRSAVTPAVRDLPPPPQVEPDPDLEIEIRQGPPDARPKERVDLRFIPGADGALQSTRAPEVMPPPIANFDGVGNNSNGAVYGGYVSPPDTVGDVGPNHYVQCVNLLCQVFNKAGTALTPVFQLSSLFTTLGGDCANFDNGDPIVLYDSLADRWMLSQFAVDASVSPPYDECVAISQSGDPTGSYYAYDFVIPSSYFNDYPKFGVWPDAYYMTAPLFGGVNFGQGAFVMNRAKMLVGDPTAEMLFFDLTLDYPGLQRILPADVDGPPPPAGTPNYVATIAAEEFLDAQDGIRLFEVATNWFDPGSSTFSELSFSGGSLAVAAYDPTLTEVSGTVPCSFTSRDDIEQPAPASCASRIDSLSNRPMHRLAYRNFGTHESLVFTHTVDANATPPSATSGHLAAVRYYELRRTLPAGSFTVNEQATYAPDAVHRFMGSAAMDAQGNLAVGYSVSDAVSVFPGVRYAGRLAGDPPGGLVQGEATFIAGGRSQTSTGSRWGDYSAMSVDPADDCTFWYTQEYYNTVAPVPCSSTVCWQTRIGSFMFPGCTSPVAYGTLQGTVTDANTALPISGALVQTGDGYSDVTDGSGDYSLSVPAGSYSVTASKSGYGSASAAGVVVTGSGTTTQDFSLGNGTLAGQVTDSTSAAVIAGATVVLSTGPVDSTDGSGNYSFLLGPGTYGITVSAPGYFDESISGLVVGGTGTTVQNVALDRAPVLAASSTTVNDTAVGNGNNEVERNECFELDVTLTNTGLATATGISGTLSTTTPGVTVNSGVSGYTDIAPAGVQTNNTPFALRTEATFQVGLPIDFTLSLATDQGPLVVQFQVTTGASISSSYSATGPVAIPDNDFNGAALTIPVSGFSGVLSKVRVQLYLTHTYDGDLIVRLLNPAGDAVTLSYQRGGAGAGFGTDCPASGNDTTFDDDAATPIALGTPPYVGSFEPDQPLSTFAGLPSTQVNGTWQLQAIDLGPADIGNIECVTLILNKSQVVGGCRIFNDGFESGDTGEWSAAQP